jgi:hypothetical protein
LDDPAVYDAEFSRLKLALKNPIAGMTIQPTFDATIEMIEKA